MITLIVPFAAGGPTDVVARIVGARMSLTLHQQIVIENVVGTGGTIAGTRTMRSAPDGYTIMMGHMGTHAAAVSLYPKLAYNPSVDLAPIGMVASMPVLLLAKKSLPARNLTEFIAYLKQNGSKIVLADAGKASVSEVSCQMFDKLVGATPKIMAFQGSGPAMDAVVAGRADYMCDQIVTVVPQQEANTIQVYAISSEQRSPAISTVPTSIEAGLPQFQVTAWNALFAPKNTPSSIVAALNDALNVSLDDPTVRKRLLELGAEIPDREGRSPDALAALVKREISKWSLFLRSDGNLPNGG